MRDARPTKTWARAVFFWLAIAFVVWNGFFGLLVSRGEKQYLLGQARHALGVGPRVTIHEVMSRTVADAVRVASTWAGFVFVAGVGWTAYMTSKGRSVDHSTVHRQ
jgi:hypothetical protein